MINADLFFPIPRNSLKLTAKATQKLVLADYFVLLGPGLFSGQELIAVGRVLGGSPTYIMLIYKWLVVLLINGYFIDLCLDYPPQKLTYPLPAGSFEDHAPFLKGGIYVSFRENITHHLVRVGSQLHHSQPHDLPSHGMI